VFCHPLTGNPLDTSKLLRRFKAAMSRAGLGHRLGGGGITFHSLRHTFGTQMGGAGVPLRTLQEWMGHRDFATTLVYADYQPDERREAELVERAFAPRGANLGADLSETERNSAPLTGTDRHE
jgi:integrase